MKDACMKDACMKDGCMKDACMHACIRDDVFVSRKMPRLSFPGILDDHLDVDHHSSPLILSPLILLACHLSFSHRLVCLSTFVVSSTTGEGAS